MTLIAIVAIACAVIGFLTGRWLAVAAVAAVWPLLFLGTAAGLWGSGLGDGWQYVLVLGTAVMAGAAALGVALRRYTPASARGTNAAP
jgi:hypothetical protein